MVCKNPLFALLSSGTKDASETSFQTPKPDQASNIMALEITGHKSKLYSRGVEPSEELGFKIWIGKRTAHISVKVHYDPHTYRIPTVYLPHKSSPILVEPSLLFS